MKRTVLVWVTLAWAVWTGGGRASAQQVVLPNEPGRATQARVYVINRDRADAIPVTLQGVAPSDPLRVVVTGTPSVALSDSATMSARAARQNWEYRQITVPGGDDPTPGLNSAGAEGWEAIGPAL